MEKVEGSAAVEQLLRRGAEVEQIDPSAIVKGWRARQDYGDIDELAKSIERDGQLQPVLVRPAKDDPNKYTIIAGLRRVRACKRLGQSVAAIVVHPQDEIQALDIQLAENVARKNFEALEVAEGLKRRKELYEKAHPETALGGAGRGRSKEGRAKRFAADAAEKLGVSETKVHEMVRVAKLPEDVKKDIASKPTKAARNRAVAAALKAKSEAKPKKQAAERKSKSDVTTTLFAGTMQSVGERLLEVCDKGAHLVITSPPAEAPEDWASEVKKYTAKTAQLLAFFKLSDIDAGFKLKLELERGGWRVRGLLVWHDTQKQTALKLNRNYLNDAQGIVWATAGDDFTFNAEKDQSARTMVLPYPSLPSKDKRAVQPPLQLLKLLIARHSNERQLIIDPFAGACNVLVAARGMQRNSIGVENRKPELREAKARLGQA